MATLTTAASVERAAVGVRKRRRRIGERWLSPALLSPSIVAMFIFVYGFIAFTFWVSISNWKTNRRDLSISDPTFKTYNTLFNQTRFQIDLRNTLVFTVLFLILAVFAGLALALLLDRHVMGSNLFRSIFLFPYAISFITTGVVWRWIFNPETGVNALFDQTGINDALGKMGVGPLKPGWITDPAVVWQVNGALEKIFPWADVIKANLGIPVAMIPVVIAATWQLSGFAMAMYLAGLGTIPGEIKEAALVDGASDWRAYKDIIIPLLKPITISTMIILGHVSLKIFDLIYAMSGKGPGFATDVPGIFVYDKLFGAQQYNLGSAASIVMLVLVSLVIVPYLWRQLKELT
ncbi:MAG TPA: sugar ABC transporter permease [Thermomicrobiales bacterium]|jgi:glucose/mannose transport system permease protein|nr:sugar ABC transporter permease [Thermomicrobiales bacterium]